MSETMNRPSVDPRKFPAYDQALLGILQNEGKIELFLDMMFSFLYRKTDYFRLLTKDSPNKNLGFPPGVAGKMVEFYFEKYMKCSFASYEDMINEMKKKEEASKIAVNLKNEEPKIQEVSLDDELETENISEITEKTEIRKIEISENTTSISEESLVDKMLSRSKPKSNTPKSNTPKSVSSLQESESLTFNGAQTSKYSWSQTFDDVDVTVILPEIETAKSLKINIKQFPKPYLKVETPTETIIDEPLKYGIIADESTWTFDKKQHQLSINLAKKEKRWWDGLLPSEEPIDVQKNVEATRPMEDLPEDERAVVRKLQFDQHQKRLGKPTSKEITVNEQLKKGWNAEGSPFQGTDFDPSKFNIS